MAEDHIYLDLRGLLCPMPALIAAKRLKKLMGGGVMVIEVTDPVAEVDIGLLAEENGLSLTLEIKGEVMCFTLKKPKA